MTDRVEYLTVALESDVRIDHIATLSAAIQQIRGVLEVGVGIADPSAYVARERALADTRKRVLEALELR